MIDDQRPADWYLYECTECGQRTFLSPCGGKLNECACGETQDARVTPLYAGGRLLGKTLVEITGGPRRSEAA